MRGRSTLKTGLMMTAEISGNVLARIGATHGYRFDGDSVQINAELNFSDAALGAATHWALQLWSSAEAFHGKQLAGVKVAEVGVYPAAGGQHVVATVAAMPPAGSAEQNMALALVGWGADGLPMVADLAIYPVAESFVQPRLSGNVTCALADGMATLSVDSIDNPRAEDNLSGTLALEVWALDAPYAGGSWQGTPVASVILGVLGGGNAWSACHFVVPAAVPEGPGVLTVMLREWGAAGYVTRDFCNLVLEAPAVVQHAPVAKKPATKPAAKVAKAPSKASKLPAGKGTAVNSASEAELLAVKGLSAAVAKAIIAGRPYASLDDLCRAKGMGPKLLAKLRDMLVL